MQVYVYSRTWLSLLFLCAGIALLAGVAGVFIEPFTRSPDMFSYAASLTYNNPYFVLPPQSPPQAAETDSTDELTGNATARGNDAIDNDDGRSGQEARRARKCSKGLLGGMDRARALRNVQVVVGDVRGEEPVGRLAFTTGVEVRPLEKNRLYT